MAIKKAMKIDNSRIKELIICSDKACNSYIEEEIQVFRSYDHAQKAGWASIDMIKWKCPKCSKQREGS